MLKNCNNYAFIDGQNLHLGVLDLGWKLDLKKFRKYLEDKYSIKKAYIFIGYIKDNQKFYNNLQNMGYVCIYKPILKLKNGKVKGNVDAELVLHTMIQYGNFNRAIIVSGDGDFYCLAKFLLDRNKLERILIPNQLKYSALLNKLSLPYKNIIDYVGNKRNILEYIIYTN